MIKIHKLEDGDIIKLIPRIVDGKVQWITTADILSYNTEYFGSDVIGEIIGEDRNKKLDKLGI